MKRPIIAIIFAFCSLLFSAAYIYAQSAADLQSKIDQRTKDIVGLEKEIAGYQKQINDLSDQADSLSSTIKSLDLTQKKLAADIKVTENKIASKGFEIEQLGKQITVKANNIEDDKRIIADTFMTLNETGDKTLPEMLLSQGSLSNAWGSLESLGILQKGIYDKIGQLSTDKTRLEDNKKASEKAKAELVALNNQIKDQRAIVLSTTAEKNSLLKETKQSQSSYQKLLADKKALKDAFEQEVLNYEQQLRLTIDTSRLPHTGSGVLSWPLDNIFITQYFGNTPFATANPQIYNGKGHTGVDFRASIGTPVKAALSGVVAGVGNTDLVPGCYSYGKWVMVDHPNGLSTLYAHLSQPSVSKGQSVSTGQLIGYSGNTGYSTGPHLHFGVYATQGVVIKTFDNSINCKGALIPLADFKAYLNPLSYL